MSARRLRLIAVGTVMSLALLWVGIVWVTAVHNLDGTVVARSWSRSVDIGANVWVDRTTDNAYPAGVRNLTSVYTIISWRSTRYLVGTTCTKSRCTAQYSTRIVPVHGWRYTYQVQEWQVQATAVALGASAPPHWPTPTLDPGQNVGDRHQSYRLVVRAANGETYTLDLAEAAWSPLSVGTTVHLRVNRLDQPSLDP